MKYLGKVLEFLRKIGVIPRESSETFYPYLAGLIDGEGYLGIIQCRDQKIKCGFYRRCVIDITNTSLKMLSWIQKRLGYGKIYEVRKSEWGKKRVYHLMIYTKHLRILLPKIIPYLFLKREKAESMMRELR